MADVSLTVVSTKLDDNTLEKLDALCEESQRNRSQTLKLALLEWLAKQKPTRKRGS